MSAAAVPAVGAWAAAAWRLHVDWRLRCIHLRINRRLRLDWHVHRPLVLSAEETLRHDRRRVGRICDRRSAGHTFRGKALRETHEIVAHAFRLGEVRQVDVALFMLSHNAGLQVADGGRRTALVGSAAIVIATRILLANCAPGCNQVATQTNKHCTRALFCHCNCAFNAVAMHIRLKQIRIKQTGKDVSRLRRLILYIVNFWQILEVCS
eukprot:Gregarina_sp_Pseudo_9__1973@NODE_2365_length_1024_cov_392_244670_g2178_i0_p2_GENE_NODE_2365_length_1024_cov_392_244670_g2178_i0NODE_2365_length_1024_cov_392_244670_g2178_i0_p2_ORF_typecomplete_len209_score3_50AWPM19/PF05512_11/1_8e03AWPM19/PF05512_11/0_24_NODE_2365_length_1024_cov_392_244670_g2178_i0287913